MVLHAPPPTRYAGTAPLQAKGQSPATSLIPRGPTTIAPSRVMQGRFHGSLQAKGEAFALPRSFALPTGQGQPLPDEMRGRMERFFGTDFSGVRVHVGPQAPAIGALAFTVGNTIVFAPGQYDPASPRGQQILGHELAHVVQQRSGRVHNPFGSGLAVVQNHALEAEADRLGQRAALSIQAMPAPPAAPPHAAPPAASALQPYKVLGSDKLYSWDPDERPWSGYPYAIVPPGSMLAQHRKRATMGEARFLRRNNQNEANLVARNASEVSLRVSDDNCMAIEDTDLGRRQPKVFFATDTVITASNNALALAGSPVRLVRVGQTISILTGWWSQVTLHGVRPSLNNNTPNGLPQNCNDIASTVSGNHWTTNGGLNQTLAARQHLSGAVGGIMSEDQVRGYVGSYSNAGSRSNRTLSRAHLNQFANPGIGESYMISTINPSSRRQVVEEELFHLGRRRGQLWWWERRRMADLQNELADLPPDVQNNNPVQNVMDYESGEDRALGWPYHFGGVVAKSGADVVTLENYARGDNRQNGADPRWYFQMYSEGKSGQSFHEAHKAQGAYSNPITISVRR